MLSRTPGGLQSSVPSFSLPADAPRGVRPLIHPRHVADPSPEGLVSIEWQHPVLVHSRCWEGLSVCCDHDNDENHDANHGDNSDGEDGSNDDSVEIGSEDLDNDENNGDQDNEDGDKNGS